MSQDIVAVEVSNLFFTEVDSSGVTLSEKEGNRKVQIIIGDYEAQSIAIALENAKPARPITHDLLVSVVESSGLQLEKLVVSKIVNNTFFAELHVVQNGLQQVIDCRPSDGIALAVRVDLPIFVSEAVFAAAGVDSEESPEQKPVSAMDDLEKELNQAVENEDYEKAARIRDQINRIRKDS